MLKRKQRKLRKLRPDGSNHPKLGRLVVNRQRTVYGILQKNTKIIGILSSKPLVEYNYRDKLFGIRINKIRVM